MQVDGRLVFRARRGLTEAERRSLASELRALRGRLTPASDQDVAAQILPIMKARPSRGEGGAAEFRAAAFLDALTGLPIEALIAACRAINHGTAPGISRTFMPTPAEIAHETRRHAARLRAEMIRIDAVLQAREDFEPDPSARANSRALRRAEELSRKLEAVSANDRASLRRSTSEQPTPTGAEGLPDVRLPGWRKVGDVPCQKTGEAEGA
ncbi:hypothetical protein SAMN05216548_10714 [Faunimonas pinastri]|uniref:Uncharacterized protein n=1 Tax=Faunimonas pinastri TaxID=1855383 RepID=A0A1H9I853_9HYPH|nr:hypothetical protein [Faunimonas pinastri]SEQ70747.1 hypothetical protein SAMN05216548_10714 [Faunimonas pinastri]